VSTATVARTPIRLPRGFVRFWRSTKTARLISLVAFLAGWQLLIPLLPTVLIPTPYEVGEFMWAELRGDTLAPETVYQAFATSLRRLVTGFGIALLIGIPIGLLMGLFKRVEDFLHDFVVVGLAMPSLVWALIAAMWFGFVERSSIITVVLASMTFVIINVSEGVRAVPKDLMDMGRAYGTTDLHRVRHIVLPSLMPFLFASLRYGLANGWKGLVLAEIYASTSGAGWTIRFWYDARRAQGVIGYALFFMIFALFAERMVFRRLSDRVFRWRPAMGGQSSAVLDGSAEKDLVELEKAEDDLERETSGKH
jgi:ABC-type nitrate/sulfonate/bicarbonate transport system permease component